MISTSTLLPTPPQPMPGYTDMPGNARLLPKFDLAALCLAQGRTQVDTAREVGVDVSTIRRWTGMPSFRAAINQEREHVLGGARDRFRAMLDTALDSVEGLLQSPDEGIRLKAATLVLDKVPLFDEKALNFIGPTDTQDTDAGQFQGFMDAISGGKTSGNGFDGEAPQEFIEVVRDTLEKLVAGEVSLDEARSKLDHDDLDVEWARELLAQGGEGVGGYADGLWYCLNHDE